MKFDFELWIKEQNISDDSLVLFNESFLCYRVGAYRAAFLMSYLGFMKCLKDRLIKSSKPNLIDDKRWQAIRKSLDNDNTWESTVYTTTQEYVKDTGQNKCYLINEDLKKETEYWKIKRNECAHAKDTVIDYSHVETFWLFLQSHLAKFIINGGKEALLLKINKHFNPLYTNVDKDPTDIIRDIRLVVKPSEISGFLRDIYNNYGILDSGQEERTTLFWSKLLYSSDFEINRAFLEFMNSDEEIFCAFITVFPDKFVEFKGNDEFVRFLWKQYLFSRAYVDSERFWKLVTSILLHNVIPNNELENFISMVVEQLYFCGIPNEEQTKVLKKNGIFFSIKKKIFENEWLNRGGYTKANALHPLIIYYLDNMPLDVIVVHELNKLFEGLEFNGFEFCELYARLEEYIEKNEQFILDFRNIAKDNGILLAKCFKIEREETIS
ncbi:hypothetical protein [Bacillus thuringiensis]|uniref:hypothetical protein n=1 Tax=Bacillus thuringiensis TaxID=1428 RepID=UPI00119F815F|nr:hypothetical protein [Bacillus thuringiensis]